MRSRCRQFVPCEFAGCEPEKELGRLYVGEFSDLFRTEKALTRALYRVKFRARHRRSVLIVLGNQVNAVLLLIAHDIRMAKVF